MLLGSNSLNWFSPTKRSTRLEAIQEEDLQQLLAQCEGINDLRPMAVQSTKKDKSGDLPWVLNCILGITNRCCIC